MSSNLTIPIYLIKIKNKVSYLRTLSNNLSYWVKVIELNWFLDILKTNTHTQKKNYFSSYKKYKFNAITLTKLKNLSWRIIKYFYTHLLLNFTI